MQFTRSGSPAAALSIALLLGLSACSGGSGGPTLGNVDADAALNTDAVTGVDEGPGPDLGEPADSDTSSVDADTSSVDSDTPESDSDAGSVDSDTPESDSDAGSVDSDTPESDSDAGLVDSDTPESDSDAGLVDSDGGSVDADTTTDSDVTADTPPDSGPDADTGPDIVCVPGAWACVDETSRIGCTLNGEWTEVVPCVFEGSCDEGDCIWSVIDGQALSGTLSVAVQHYQGLGPLPLAEASVVVMGAAGQTRLGLTGEAGEATVQTVGLTPPLSVTVWAEGFVAQTYTDVQFSILRTVLTKVPGAATPPVATTPAQLSGTVSGLEALAAQTGEPVGARCSVSTVEPFRGVNDAPQVWADEAGAFTVPSGPGTRTLACWGGPLRETFTFACGDHDDCTDNSRCIDSTCHFLQPRVMGAAPALNLHWGDVVSDLEIDLDVPLGPRTGIALDRIPQGLPDANQQAAWLDLSFGARTNWRIPDNPGTFGAEPMTSQWVPAALSGSLSTAELFVQAGVFTSSGSNIPFSFTRAGPVELVEPTRLLELGGTVAAAASSPPGVVRAMWAPWPNQVFAVGDRGFVAVWDGESWEVMPTGTDLDLQAVHGLSSTDVWVSGGTGRLWRWEGESWESVAVDMDVPIDVVEVISPGVVLLAGSFTVRLLKQGELEQLDGAPSMNVQAAWASGEDHLRLVGSSGGAAQVATWDGDAWEVETVPGATTLLDVWGGGPDDVWVVGPGGVVAHDSGAGFEVVETPTTAGLRAVAGDGGGVLWVAGEDGTLLRESGSGFVELAVANQPRVDFNALVAVGAGKAVAAGLQSLRMAPILSIPTFEEPGGATVATWKRQAEWQTAPGPGATFGQLSLLGDSEAGPQSAWEVFTEAEASAVRLPSLQCLVGGSPLAPGLMTLRTRRDNRVLAGAAFGQPGFTWSWAAGSFEISQSRDEAQALVFEADCCSTNADCQTDPCKVSTCFGGACEPAVFSVEPGCCETGALYSDDFDGGGDGLVVDPPVNGVGWHILSDDDAPSGTSVLYYGNPGDLTYDNGAANSGTATLPQLALPPVGKYELTFLLALQVENSSNFDTLEIVATGLAGESVVWSRGEMSTTAGFIAQTVDLSAFAGQEVQLSLRFDTVDSAGNSTFGVKVDNLELRRLCE